jgi:prephenate dehydratase
MKTPTKGLLKKYDLAVLGPQNTYSDVCARLNFPKARIWHASSISDIFQLVKKGKIKKGFVPFENSLTGSVREAFDEFYEENIWIEKVFSLQIHLAILGSKNASAKKIKTIYSHPQPLLQSRQYLKKNFPKAVCLPMASTAAAIARAAKENDPSVAAIGSSSAGKAYGLNIIKESIEDKIFNVTYFAVIEKMPKKPDIKSAKKTFIAFEFKKDSPGSLFNVLKEFSERKINLTRIESRPSHKKAGRYVFYIDLDGNLNDPAVKSALSTIKKAVAKLKVLGCY